MPKINVYLPDDLADAVKDTGVPVSTICQRSLEQAVRRVADVRAALAGELDLDAALARLPQITARTRTALAGAVEQARTQGVPGVTTGHLLGGILSEGTNLAVRVLATVDVDPHHLAAELGRQARAEPMPDGAVDGVRRFTGPAATVVQLAVTEAISLDHNYIGCEHLLLALAAEPDGIAGTVLRAQGAEYRTVRRAVVAALAGYVHLRAQGPQAPATGTAAAEGLIIEAVRRQLAPVVERLAAIEHHVGLGDRP